MDRIVVRVCRVTPDLEDADRAIGEVAVLIKPNVALERVQTRGLNCIPDRVAVDRLSSFGYAPDRVQDNQGRVIRDR